MDAYTRTYLVCLPMRSTSGIQDILEHIIPRDIKAASGADIEHVCTAVTSTPDQQVRVVGPVQEDVSTKRPLCVNIIRK